MLREAIFHECGGAYAYPIAKDVLMVQLRAAKDDLREVHLIYGDRYGSLDVTEQIQMDQYASDQLFDYYRAHIHVPAGRFRYHFLLDDGKDRLWYNEFGFSNYRPSGYHSGYFQFPYAAEADLFQVPDWVEDAIIYQIFPDRFCNGDTANDPENAKEWGELPKDQMDLYGGDLAGVIEKLPYLEELGINAIYMTPIFESPTSHKYNTTDYFKIAPHFGDDVTFRKMIDECHQRGIRVILDAVFNHCGYYLQQFQDVVEKGEESPYKDWFFINDYPVTKEPLTYETFASCVWQMPKLQTSNPEVREFLLSVAEYWIREFDIDGWRLDVANEIDHAFWREFRTRAKAIKPDLYIIGETWHHSGAYLLGDQWDGIMNYHFREALIGFLGNRTMSVDEFDQRLTRNRVTYRQQAIKANWNLLDSHDTERLLTRFQEDQHAFKLAATILMTYQGVPLIYYGDEVGLPGNYDPDCRRCMPWNEEEQDLDMLAHFRKLLQIRREYEPLRRGEFRTVHKDEMAGIYIFERYTEYEQVLVIINNSIKEQEVEIDLDIIDWDPDQPVLELLSDLEINSEDRGIIIIVDAVDAAILVQ